MNLQEGQSFVLTHPERPGWCWNGHGWTNTIREYFIYDSESLFDALIGLSAIDVEATPAIMTQKPVQLTEGEYAGKWVLSISFQEIRKPTLNESEL